MNQNLAKINTDRLLAWVVIVITVLIPLHPAYCCQTDVGMTTHYAHLLQTHMAVVPKCNFLHMYPCMHV